MRGHPSETSIQTGIVGSAWYSFMGDLNFRPSLFFPFQVEDLLNYLQFCALVLVCRGFVCRGLSRSGLTAAKAMSVSVQLGNESVGYFQQPATKLSAAAAG